MEPLITPNFPKVILVATASPCNAKCVHCPCTLNPNIRKTADQFITLDNYKKIVDESGPHGAHIRLSGYGEPLMHPKFNELMEYGALKNAKVSLITNGSLMSTKKIESIIKGKLESIEISIDSHIPDVYESIRVGLKYKKTKENIMRLIETRDTVNSDMRIMVSIIDQPSKNPNIKDSVAYWNEYVDKVMVRKYVTWGILPKDDCAVHDGQRGPCPYPWERLMIDPAGNIRLCPYDDQKLIPHFGNISKCNIKESWDCERMEAIRIAHKRKVFELAELCCDCTDWAYRSWDHNYRKALNDARKG